MLLAPLGAPLFAYLLLRSRLCYKHGTVAWKGREYAGSRDTVPAEIAAELPSRAE